MPPYNLEELFSDENNVDYKIDCKYDFYFVGEEPIPPQNLGYRLATREPWQTSIVDDAIEMENRGEKELMDISEVRREKVWSLLAKNLFEFPMSPDDFIRNKY